VRKLGFSIPIPTLQGRGKELASEKFYPIPKG